eukprot:4370251-Pyramimonas_sp.AAC.2
MSRSESGKASWHARDPNNATRAPFRVLDVASALCTECKIRACASADPPLRSVLAGLGSNKCTKVFTRMILENC